jgi:thiol-disulfide isomerase/thioredoxin
MLPREQTPSARPAKVAGCPHADPAAKMASMHDMTNKTRWTTAILATALSAVTATILWTPAGPARAAETKDAPAADVWKTVFSDGLVDANGKAVPTDSLKGKLVAVYFSAHWCPPCKAFTPKLVKFRDDNAADIEVVFVSSDRSQKEKDTYMSEAQMKWPTVPWRSKSGNDLKSKYKVTGIPTLVVLSPKGNLVSAKARAEVTTNPGQCIETWKKAATEADKQ